MEINRCPHNHSTPRTLERLQFLKYIRFNLTIAFYSFGNKIAYSRGEEGEEKEVDILNVFLKF